MLLQDIRYALRTLAKNSGSTVVAVTCLSLGIGVNSAIFSLVDGVILNPYPYPDSRRLIVINSTNRSQGFLRAGISYADFKDLRDRGTTSSKSAAFSTRSLTTPDGTWDPERFLGVAVSSRLFGIGDAGRSSRRSDRRAQERVTLLSSVCAARAPVSTGLP